MKICILDADTLGHDLNLDRIKAFGSVEKYSSTLPEQTATRIQKAEVVISNKVVLGSKEMQSAENLKLICVAATGYNNVDLASAKALGIAVTNVKGYSTESVVQTVFSYILLFVGNMPQYADYTASGKWQQSNIFTHLGFPFSELSGKTMGIIGYGTIGKRTAEIARAFNMKVIIAESLRADADNQGRVSFETVLKESDFLSIHAPLNDETRNMIRLHELKMMKPTAFLINTARGGIVNEADLRKALEDKIIAGAGADVLSQEPPREGNPLIGAPSLVLTPHIAWTSKESRQRLLKGITENIRIYTEGHVAEIDLCRL